MIIYLCCIICDWKHSNKTSKLFCFSIFWINGLSWSSWIIRFSYLPKLIDEQNQLLNYFQTVRKLFRNSRILQIIHELPGLYPNYLQNFFFFLKTSDFCYIDMHYKRTNYSQITSPYYHRIMNFRHCQTFPQSWNCHYIWIEPKVKNLN